MNSIFHCQMTDAYETNMCDSFCPGGSFHFTYPLLTQLRSKWTIYSSFKLYVWKYVHKNINILTRKIIILEEKLGYFSYNTIISKVKKWSVHFVNFFLTSNFYIIQEGRPYKIYLAIILFTCLYIRKWLKHRRVNVLVTSVGIFPLKHNLEQ